MAPDVARSCSRCGTTWWVPARIAREKGPSRLEMSGRRMMAAGSSASLFSTRRTSDQLRLGNAEAKLNRVLAAATCPRCAAGLPPVMDLPPPAPTDLAPISIKGLGGKRLDVDFAAGTVTLTMSRMAASNCRTERVRTLSLADLGGVVHHPPKRLRSGTLQLIVDGEDNSPPGRPANHPFTLVIAGAKAAAFDDVAARLNQFLILRASASPAEAPAEPPTTAPPTGTTATPPSAAGDPVETLRQLAEMARHGLITAAEFDAKRAEILGRM